MCNNSVWSIYSIDYAWEELRNQVDQIKIHVINLTILIQIKQCMIELKEWQIFCCYCNHGFVIVVAHRSFGSTILSYIWISHLQ